MKELYVKDIRTLKQHGFHYDKNISKFVRFDFVVNDTFLLGTVVSLNGYIESVTGCLFLGADDTLMMKMIYGKERKFSIKDLDYYEVSHSFISKLSKLLKRQC